MPLFYAETVLKMTREGDEVVFRGPYIDKPKGEIHEVRVTAKALETYYAGEYIHRAFPELSADDREFLMSGISPEGWDETFGEEA